MRQKGFFWFLAGVLIAGVAIVYSNHFENSFHFDDSHVIEQNIYVRGLRNIPKFFTDVTTFSALPANRSYRPVLITLFAVAYRAGGDSPVWFHIIAFSMFMMLGTELFFFSGGYSHLIQFRWRKRYRCPPCCRFLHSPYRKCRNTELYQRGVGPCLTLLMVSSLLLFAARPAWRKYGLYLFPAALAMLTKEVSAVFPLFLLAYVVLVEKRLPLPDLFKAGKRSEFGRSVLMVLPSVLVCGVLIGLSSRMLPATFTPSTISRSRMSLRSPL